MKKTVDAKITQEQERFFSSYILIVLLESKLHDPGFLDGVMPKIITAHQDELVKLGLSKDQAHAKILQAAQWVTTRAHSLQMISEMPGSPHTYKVTFVDELDRDPEYLAMKELMNRPSQQ